MQSLIVGLLAVFESVADEEVAQRSWDIHENNVLTMQAPEKKKLHHWGTSLSDEGN